MYFLSFGENYLVRAGNAQKVMFLSLSLVSEVIETIERREDHHRTNEVKGIAIMTKVMEEKTFSLPRSSFRQKSN